jgi:hypothetical protein
VALEAPGESNGKCPSAPTEAVGGAADRQLHFVAAAETQGHERVTELIQVAEENGRLADQNVGENRSRISPNRAKFGTAGHRMEMMLAPMRIRTAAGAPEHKTGFPHVD